MDEKYLLETKGIEKRFGGVHALKGISIEINKGEILGLVGENGAGKSTLIKIFSGVIQQDSGDIFYEGKEKIFNSPADSMKSGINTVYQELSLVKHRTVAQNIFCLRESTNSLGLINWKTLNENAKKILDDLDVIISPKAYVKDLSIADQQIVEIAKAISREGKLLIMDEPTSALSKDEINQLFILMRRLSDLGHSILFVSHKIEEVIEVSDRVIILRDGNLAGKLSIKDTNLSQVIELMVGKKLENLFPGERSKVGKEILSIKNFSYKKKFKNVNFNLSQGEILGIFGPIGSGRTELVKAICGMGEKESGDIYFEGNKVKVDSPAMAIQKGIVYMTEDRINEGLFFKLSVQRNLIASSLRSFSKIGVLLLDKIRVLSEKMIELLRIVTPGIHTPVISLSGGNQQKVLLGKALLTKPKILIADEPTRGIDVGAKTEIYAWLRKLASDGVAIIMVNCELPEIMGVTDRLIVMYSGEVKAILDTNKTSNKEVLSYCYDSSSKK